VHDSLGDNKSLLRLKIDGLVFQIDKEVPIENEEKLVI